MNATLRRARRTLIDCFGPQAALFLGAILTAAVAVYWGVKIIEHRLF